MIVAATAYPFFEKLEKKTGQMIDLSETPVSMMPICLSARSVFGSLAATGVLGCHRHEAAAIPCRMSPLTL